MTGIVDARHAIEEPLIEYSGNSSFIKTYLGTNNNTDYFFLIGLSPTAGTLEYYFTILEFDRDSGHETCLWENADIKPIFSRDDRASIKTLLFKNTYELVSGTMPEHFVLTTFSAHLPSKALEKFKTICDIFEALGYDIDGPEKHHGRYSWVVTRGV